MMAVHGLCFIRRLRGQYVFMSQWWMESSHMFSLCTQIKQKAIKIRINITLKIYNLRLFLFLACRFAFEWLLWNRSDVAAIALGTGK